MGPTSQSGGAHTRVSPSGVAGVWSGFFDCTVGCHVPAGCVCCLAHSGHGCETSRYAGGAPVGRSGGVGFTRPAPGWAAYG